MTNKREWTWLVEDASRPDHEVEVEAITSSNRRIRCVYDRLDMAWYRGAIAEDVVAWRIPTPTPPTEGSKP